MIVHCPCGQDLWRDEYWNGVANVPEFLAITGRVAEPVTHCPKCGELLTDAAVTTEV